MINTNATNFRSKLFSMLEQSTRYNETINISTKYGNAVLINEDDYNNLMATLQIISIPGMKEKIIEGLNTPVSECLMENEVEW